LRLEAGGDLFFSSADEGHSFLDVHSLAVRVSAGIDVVDHLQELGQLHSSPAPIVEDDCQLIGSRLLLISIPHAQQ
jgi:hypothetical protein